jgi:dihydrofolate synthase/folylpolyglutamate synthase
MKTAQERIGEYMRFGSKLGLERMEALCNTLKNPEKDLRVIHVAGTNGKGSVCRYIYETLLELGYTAGIFTSPYVGDFRERIEVNREMIPEEKLEELTDRVIRAARELADKGDPPTEFEIVTMVGLLYFSEEKPDFTVLEVGLGGRGDSTNIIQKPLLSIITGIAFDHMDRLGNTIEEIAWEKAGIIKKGCAVISGAEGAAAKVIARTAYELGAPLIDVSKIKFQIISKKPGGYVFNTNIDGRNYNEIELSMAGEHQVRNAVTALCALSFLRDKKIIHGDGEALRRGLKAARPLARFYIASEDPYIIFDGAHNPDGARALTKTLADLFPDRRILFVCSLLGDKEISAIISEFSRAASSFIVTASGNERSLSAEELSKYVFAAGGSVAAEAQDPKEAYNIAIGSAGKYDVIVFAGSLYMTGEVLREMNKNETGSIK